MADMPLKIKSSKFRHVFGQPTRKDGCFENIRITKNAHDSNFCAVNPKFLAVVLESVGGGAFLVLPIKQVGRVDINAPKVCGHSAPITDIKWNPFDDHVIASSSDDMTIKVWEIPELGLHSNMTNCVVELCGHGRRVTFIEWHPTAEDILLSCAFDYRCIVWDVAHGQPLNVISCHSNTIYSLSWNPNGSLFATSCKDKKIRVIDPRTGCVLQEGAAHTGLKACKVVFLNNHQLFTTGFSKGGDREIALWDASDLSSSLHMEAIDYSSGVLLPYYDSDIDVIYLAGKGDGNIRYFEVLDNSVAFLNQYPSSDPQRGLGQMPKRGLDVSKCEIARFYKLHTNKQIIEPLPMIVPRRSDEFAEHIYPPTLAANPAMTAEEWISGIDREPVRVSVKEIADRGSNSEPSRVGSLRAYTKAHQRTQVVKPVQKSTPAPPRNAPASIQNMYKLCTDTSKVSLRVKEPHESHASPEFSDHDSSPPAANLLPSQIRQQEQQKHSPHTATTQQDASKQMHSPQKNVHGQSHSSHQSPHNKQEQQHHSNQPVRQAHVRPHTQSTGNQQHFTQPTAGGSSYQQQELSTHNSQLHQHSDRHQQQHPSQQQQHPSQQQQHHSESAKSYSSQQVHQQPHSQPLKWKNNLAWQKAAIPVSSSYDKVTATQFKVIGHHFTSPNPSRQPSCTEQSYIQASLETDSSAQTAPPSSAVSHPPSHADLLAYLSVAGSDSQHIRSKSCPAPGAADGTSAMPNVIVVGTHEHTVASRDTKVETGGKEKLRTGEKEQQASAPEDRTDIPLAYRYTSSAISSHHDTSCPAKGMSEVERKKKMKQMKQKIKRSASASKVESMKPSAPSEKTGGRQSPPARLQSDATQSSDLMEEQRKILISKKVAELKRIRDLARAYAEGELQLVSGQSEKLSKRVRRQPITETIEPMSRTIPMAAVQPEQHTSSGQSKPDRFALPAHIEERKSKSHSSRESKQSRRQREQLRSTNVSRYDNASPSDVDTVPKFPVSCEDSRSLYDNQSAEIGDSTSAASKVSAPIVPQMKPQQSINGAHTTTSLSNDELHKAYFKQCEEIKHLRQQNQSKDKKIESLEKELGQLKKMIITM